MNQAIEIAIEEFRATQYAFRQAALSAANARDLLRNAEYSQKQAKAKMDEAKSALFGAIADTE